MPCKNTVAASETMLNANFLIISAVHFPIEIYYQEKLREKSI